MNPDIGPGGSRLSSSSRDMGSSAPYRIFAGAEPKRIACHNGSAGPGTPNQGNPKAGSFVDLGLIFQYSRILARCCAWGLSVFTRTHLAAAQAGFRRALPGQATGCGTREFVVRRSQGSDENELPQLLTRTDLFGSG